MAWNKPTALSRVKDLKSLQAITADPNLGTRVRNVYPLTGQLIGAPRTTTKTLGTGAYGRVNLESFSEGNVATKYITSDINETISDTVGEVATLNYLRGLPNVAPIISLESVAPNASALPFPAIILGKAESDLYSANISNWKELYSIIIQVLRGYYTLHSMKIAHRDTKPLNMLLTSYDEVWISDFGKSRYIDTGMPSPGDNYSGTFWYASPESLIKFEGHRDKTPTDYFKNDSWAVGASLYNIITGKPYYTGDTEVDCISELFLRKGTPLPEDGQLYTLFQSWSKKTKVESLLKTNAGTKVVDQDPSAVTSRIMHRVRVPDADMTVLSKIATMISRLMEYDVKKRLTIIEALQMPGLPGLPPILTPPFITPQITELSSYPNDITPVLIDSLLYRLYPAAKEFEDKDSLPYVLDRTSHYIYSFLQIYKDNPKCNKANLDSIGATALLLSICLFGVYFQYITMNDVIKNLEINHSFNINDGTISEFLLMYLSSNIQFYGRTLFDEIVQSAPSMTTEEKQTYGLLNYVCYQKSIFPLYNGTLDILKDEILEFVKDGRMPPKMYMLDEFKEGVEMGSKTQEVIQHFIEYVTPSTGGRRYRKQYKKSRRVKRRKHNTTLKVRNG